jgi:hypothetical protein
MCSSSARIAGLNFLKVSSVTSARARTALPRTGQSSARLRHTPTSAEEFSLSGPSDLPDPKFNAYRKDLADVALAGKVIASHYAEPLARSLAVAASLHDAPLEASAIVRDLQEGEPFAMLDDSLGWAWGYAGEDRRVGYLRTASLGAP